eukprot:gene31003-38878_t
MIAQLLSQCISSRSQLELHTNTYKLRKSVKTTNDLLYCIQYVENRSLQKDCMHASRRAYTCSSRLIGKEQCYSHVLDALRSQLRDTKGTRLYDRRERYAAAHSFVYAGDKFSLSYPSTSMCRFDDRRQTNLSLISHESYAARALQKRVSTFAKLDDEGDLAMPSRLADTSERFTTANAETSMVKYFPEDADEIDHATPCPETVAQKLSCATLGVQIVQDDAPISSGERPTPLVDHDSSIATSDRFPESPKPADAYRDDSRERQATTDVAELSDSEVSFQGDVQEILFELPKIVDAFCTSTLPSTRDDLCLVAAPVLQQPSDDDGSRLVPKMSHDADAQTSFDFATSENELDNTEEGAALWKSELSVLDANFFDTGTDIAQSSQKAELTPDL